MNKLFSLLMLSLMFASLQCDGNKPVTSGKWEYMNTSGTYIPYTELETAINDTGIAGFDKATSGAHGWNLEDGKGTTAGVFCYIKGSSQQQQQQFMLTVFDSEEKVKSVQNYGGSHAFEITKTKEDSIYAQCDDKDGRFHYLILIRNRMLIHFMSYKISPNDLYKISMEYNTNAFEKLIK